MKKKLKKTLQKVKINLVFSKLSFIFVLSFGGNDTAILPLDLNFLISYGKRQEESYRDKKTVD